VPNRRRVEIAGVGGNFLINGGLEEVCPGWKKIEKLIGGDVY